ncbi:MAG: cytochrome C oxidase subunit IV family protein [Anaerolineae bacterium]|nr:cytochrome C oxidase subunit IV family protein [Anaerolineae bacterium]
MSDDKTMTEHAAIKAEQESAAEAAPVDVASVEGHEAIVALGLDEHPQTPSEALPHIAPDYTILFGRRINANIYVVVFGILAIVTAAEIGIAEIFPDGFVRMLLLVGLSLVKAVLVMLFYMHLREDSKIFAVAIALPLFVGIISAMFLLAVPSTGY